MTVHFTWIKVSFDTTVQRWLKISEKKTLDNVAMSSQTAEERSSGVCTFISNSTLEYLVTWRR